MSIVKSLVVAYLGIGVLYALYIWLFAGDPWYLIPVNILGAPISIVYNLALGVKRSRRKLVSPKDIFAGKKAVIFDMDGTLIDTAVCWDKAMLTVLKNIGISVNLQNYAPGLDLNTKYIKIKDDNNLDIKVPISTLVEQTKKEFLKTFENIEPRNGFWNLARELKLDKKFKLVLASNTDRGILDLVIKKLGMENVFDFVIGGNEVKKVKPHPEMFLKAAKSLSVKPKDVVVFEDSIVGAKAAAKAGMSVIVIWNNGEPEDYFPKEVKMFVHDFSCFPDALDVSVDEVFDRVVKTIKHGKEIEG